MATELELKLMVQSEYLKSASDFLDGICRLSDTDGQSRQPTLTLMNAYFDTEEASLMQAGMALRIRAVNDQFIQTVKPAGVVVLVCMLVGSGSGFCLMISWIYPY